MMKLFPRRAKNDLTRCWAPGFERFILILSDSLGISCGHRPLVNFLNFMDYDYPYNEHAVAL
jgi:hypothetical protein